MGADTLPLAVGLVAAFVSGLAAVWFLIRYLQRRTLVVFVVYRLVLGLLILAPVARQGSGFDFYTSEAHRGC